MTSRRRASRRLRVLRLSVEWLGAHKLRTALSVSGLAIGVATAMVMVAVGEGAERRVLERIRAMGSNVLVVTSAPAPRVAGRQRQHETLTALRVADAEAIAEESRLAAATAPAVMRSLVARVDDRNATVAVYGTTAQGLRIRRVSARMGRVFDETEDRERRRVAVIGPTAARLLFGGADPVGREIRIGSVPFEIIGVAAPRGADVGGTDMDNEILIPLEAAIRRVLNIPFIHAILVQARAAEGMAALEHDVREILQRRHPTRAGEGGIEPFVIQNQAVLLRTQRGASRVLSRMVVGVAALALAIGGVGIAAVMGLAVRDRRAEIGLRRALGARRRDIQLQFVFESAVLAALGGAAGIVIGVVVSAAASAFGGWATAVSWWAVLAGLGVSTVLGLTVGAIPAARAAQLEPSAALRT